MSTVIKVEGLGKKYLLNHQSGETSFRETLTSVFKRKEKRNSTEEFWALNDLNFEVKQGDKVGIVGRNGAGKSTLLKTLSRIIEPTKGKISVKGRIASLLEVGTGFHPELTGRENIFLNGAILGMSRNEIRKKFDEIVSFAEVEKFLDTPVKRYSSGMYVRLAFSVAAHLEPEILIVDEVLAVGDAQFQKKCLGKMEEVGKDGRTLLFVSHNMNTINSLCNTAILLDKGKLKEVGTVKDIVRSYSNLDGDLTQATAWESRTQKVDNEWFNLISLKIVDAEGRLISHSVSRDDEIYVEMVGDITNVDAALTVGYSIYNEDQEPLYWTLQTDCQEAMWPAIKLGRNRLISRIPVETLNEGTYFIEPIGGLYFRKWLFEPGKTEARISFKIEGCLSKSPLYQYVRPTLIAPLLPWKNG